VLALGYGRNVGHRTRPFVQDGELWSAAFSPDGAQVVTASGGTVRVWGPATGADLARFAHEVEVRSAAFGPYADTAPQRQQLGLQAIGPKAVSLGTPRSTVAELPLADGGVLLKQIEHLSDTGAALSVPGKVGRAGRVSWRGRSRPGVPPAVRSIAPRRQFVF
jgi:hypothetical protein